jgi:hypothetical protein
VAIDRVIDRYIDRLLPPERLRRMRAALLQLG